MAVPDDVAQNNPKAGTGILLLPSPWGLTDGIKEKAIALADVGFNVLVPDLNDGIVATDVDQAQQILMEIDINVTASLVQSSSRLLRAASTDPTAAIGLLGYAAGASWALWMSARVPDECAAVTTFYGTQSISFDDATASYLLHFAENDSAVTDEDSALMGLNLQLAKRDFRVEVHAGVADGFAEPGHPNFDAETEAVAWRQTQEFFASQLLQ